MAHDHGWEIESHQRAFAASKDAHKATDGVELEPDAYCGAVAACYLKAAACPGEPAGKDRRTRCPTGFNLPAAPTAAAPPSSERAWRRCRRFKSMAFPLRDPLGTVEAVSAWSNTEHHNLLE